jgi:hypothetical protein
MKVSAKKIQNWCNEAISPLAWQRLIVKSLPALREKGLELASLMNPSEDLLLDEEALEVLNSSVTELYQVEIPSEYVLA